MKEPSVRGTVLTRNATGEMLSNKAVHAGVSNGCPVSARVEALRRTPEKEPPKMYFLYLRNRNPMRASRG